MPTNGVLLTLELVRIRIYPLLSLFGALFQKIFYALFGKTDKPSNAEWFNHFFFYEIMDRPFTALQHGSDLSGSVQFREC